MTSTIKVNTIQDSCGSALVAKCGSTITLGASGKTVAIASGASTSGMGRTGTVDWQTGSIKTANFNASNGEGYFINTNGGAVTVTLPSSPSAGNIVAFKDYLGTFTANNATINRNGSNINGVGADVTLDESGRTIFLVYVDATVGWSPTQDDSSTIGAQFVAATGGNQVITCGNFKTHVFTAPGDFIVSSGGNTKGSTTLEYLVVGGGGAAGS